MYNMNNKHETTNINYLPISEHANFINRSFRNIRQILLVVLIEVSRISFVIHFWDYWRLKQGDTMVKETRTVFPKINTGGVYFFVRPLGVRLF